MRCALVPLRSPVCYRFTLARAAPAGLDPLWAVKSQGRMQHSGELDCAADGNCLRRLCVDRALATCVAPPATLMAADHATYDHHF